MGTIQSYINLYTNMAQQLQKDNVAINATINQFHDMRAASENMINTSAVQRMGSNISQVEQSISQARTEQLRFNDSINDAEERANALSGIYDKLKGVVAGVGIAAGAGAVFNMADSSRGAKNTLQAQTGVQGADLSEMYSGAKDLYVNGMGESLKDVAESMAQVRQITGETGDELKQTTNNAILMRDSFDFDVAESIRAVDMLTKQYRLTSAQAYDQIIQGAQNGLNKNGDLLDTVNEYAVQFKKLGFNSNEMFNMLIHGAQNGTFSVDKLGDTIKEFSIRAVDGSNTTIEGFEALGLNADTMAAKFGQGGESAKQAFAETVQALESMKDPVAQNIAGVNLFGTMWEDLGVEGVMALSNINGNVETTTKNLDMINNVQYDTAADALTTLGRTINVGLADSIGWVVNLAMFMANIISSNWTIIAPIIYGIVAALVVYNATAGIAWITTIKDVGAKIAHAAASAAETAAILVLIAAQEGLNAALMACPISWILIAIVALIAIFYAAVAAVNKFAGTSISATGILVGVFATAGAFIGNTVIGVVNAVITWFVTLWNFIGAFANFFANVFNDPVAAIEHLFLDLFNCILDIVSGAAGLIDKITGSDLSGSIDGFQNKVNKWAQNKIPEQKEYVKRVDPSKYTINKRFDYGDAYNAGYNWGKNLGSSKSKKTPTAKDYMSKANKNYTNTLSKAADPANAATAANTAKTAANTAKTANSVSATQEDLSYLRDIAEQEAINQITSPIINVEMTNNNTVNNGMDLDGISSMLRSKVEEEMYASAEGVY